MFMRIARWLRIGLIAALVALAVWRVTQSRDDTAAPPPPRTAGPSAPPALPPEALAPERLAPRAAPDGPEAALPPPADDAADVDELDGDAIAAAWANVDLAAARQALPDNLYWQLGAPTSDDAELERRARERERWNVAYGKVLSGTGSDAEIRAYFDQRARVSGDYVEFITYLLDHHEAALPERDVGLLKLARTMHLARLEEMPRRTEEALQRKREQDEARARWRAEEEAFRGGAAAADAVRDGN